MVLYNSCFNKNKWLNMAAIFVSSQIVSAELLHFSKQHEILVTPERICVFNKLSHLIHKVSLLFLFLSESWFLKQLFKGMNQWLTHKDNTHCTRHLLTSTPCFLESIGQFWVCFTQKNGHDKAPVGDTLYYPLYTHQTLFSTLYISRKVFAILFEWGWQTSCWTHTLCPLCVL